MQRPLYTLEGWGETGNLKVALDFPGVAKCGKQRGRAVRRREAVRYLFYLHVASSFAIFVCLYNSLHCYYEFLAPERAIQEDLLINKQDSVKDKFFTSMSLIS